MEWRVLQALGSVAKMRCTALEARAHVRGGEYDRLEQVQVCFCIRYGKMSRLHLSFTTLECQQQERPKSQRCLDLWCMQELCRNFCCKAGDHVQAECDKRQIQQELQKKQQLQASTVAALNSQLEVCIFFRPLLISITQGP